MQWQAVLSCRASLGIGRLMGATSRSPIARCSCALSIEDLCQHSARNPCNFFTCIPAWMHAVRAALRRTLPQLCDSPAHRYCTRLRTSCQQCTFSIHSLVACVSRIGTIATFAQGTPPPDAATQARKQSAYCRCFQIAQRSASELRAFTADILR